MLDMDLKDTGMHLKIFITSLELGMDMVLDMSLDMSLIQDADMGLDMCILDRDLDTIQLRS